MKIKPLPYSLIVKRLENNEPISLARYGDGEWRTIMGGNWIRRPVGSKRKYKTGYRLLRVNTTYYGQKNSNGCTFTQPLSRDLIRVLEKNNDYYHGMLRVALSNHREEIDIFTEAKNLKVEWYNGDVLLNRALSGDLFPFISALRKKKVLVVGQPFLGELHAKEFFTPTAYCLVPPQNAHAQKEDIEADVIHLIRQHDIDTVLWSSGLAAKVFIDDIWERTSGEVSQIDCGSMWDGFCGVKHSRSYIRKGNVMWNSLIEVNTGQREKRPGETFRRKPK